jgi:hypothetical protein
VADIRTRYPVASSVALTLSLASLSSDSANLLSGRASTAVDNRTDLDLDHLLAGQIRAGTTPTAGNVIEVWAYAPIRLASGTPTYPAAITGTDAAITLASANAKASALRLAWAGIVDATTGRDYFIPPTSIAQLFGCLPEFWGVLVINGSGAALDSSAGNHILHYQRIQQQTV